MSFSLRSLFGSLTCFCLLLGLNAIPSQSLSTVRFYDYPGVFKVKVSSYGWPSTYHKQCSAYDLPPKLPGDLTIADIENWHGDRFGRLHVFSNLIVIGLVSIAIFFVCEAQCRFRKKQSENDEV